MDDLTSSPGFLLPHPFLVLAWISGAVYYGPQEKNETQAGELFPTLKGQLRDTFPAIFLVKTFPDSLCHQLVPQSHSRHARNEPQR